MAGQRTGAPTRFRASAPAEPRRSSGHLAAEFIRSLIVSGQLQPDERIPQDELARTLEISRIPLREGLMELEREGLVRIELNRGAFVNRFDAGAVMDHYELFGLTYGLAARRALARSTDSTLADRLAVIVKASRNTNDPAEFHALVLQFHAAILGEARSPRLTATINSSARLISGNFFEQVPGSMESERRGLATILKAVKQGDADAAAEAYGAMMRKQGALVVKLRQERGLV